MSRGLRGFRIIKGAHQLRNFGFPYSTFTDWKMGRYVPKTDKLQKIADHFDVSLEYLTSGSERKDFITARDKQLLDLFHALSDDNKELLEKTARALKEIRSDEHSA